MSTESLSIERLFAYEGANIYGPQPGVRLRLRCARDYAKRLRSALKEGALAIGLVIAYLEVETQLRDNAVLVEARFTTSQPQIGVALCQYVVTGMLVELRHDDEWDHAGPLYALQAQRRSMALPVAAMQLVAEARQRNLPVLRLADGQIQIGYGTRSWRCHPADLDRTRPPLLPWAQINRIPIYVVTGTEQRSGALALLSNELGQTGLRARVIDNAGFAETVALLADPGCEAAVIGLSSDAILSQGVAFDRCDQAIITDISGALPSMADTEEEWLHALGVPMLLCANPARIRLADPRLRALAPFAPNGVVDYDR